MEYMGKEGERRERGRRDEGERKERGRRQVKRGGMLVTTWKKKGQPLSKITSSSCVALFLTLIIQGETTLVSFHVHRMK